KNRLVCGAEQELLGKPEALGAIKDRLVPAMRRDAALDACHLSSLNPQRSADGLAVGVVHRLLLVVLALSLLRLVLEHVALPRAGAHELAGLGDANSLGDAFAGLDLRHWSRSPCRRWTQHRGGWARGSCTGSCLRAAAGARHPWM